jgi:hypothetical protein
MALQLVQLSRRSFLRLVASSKINLQSISFILLAFVFILGAKTAFSEEMQSNVNSESVDGLRVQRFSALRAASLGTKIGGSVTTNAVSGSGLSLSSSLPTGTVGIAYSGSVLVSGGIAPYSLSVSSGALPAGLALDPTTGQISGTPTVAIIKTFWVRASDSTGNTGRLHTQITISMGTTTTTTPVVTLAVSPTSATLSPTRTQQFSASVQGTSNTAVSWAASSGSIDSTGLFTAPTVATNTGITITATSAADPTAQATAAVTINPITSISVVVSPSTASLVSGGTQQFSASVQGTSNSGVAWSATGGTISAAGLLTAPVVSTNTNITVTAASLANSTVSSTASVTITPPAPSTAVSGTLCGTDSNGVPTDDSQCGASGTNPYSGENATDLNSWCGGSLPGICNPIQTCNQSLVSGTYSSHQKYYLTADMNCGASSLALTPASYVDLNLNGHTITGALFENGGLKGFHIFNGTINCNIGYPSQLNASSWAYGCLDVENNGVSFTQGGGDDLQVHHLIPTNSYAGSTTLRFTGALKPSGGAWTDYPLKAYNLTCTSVPAPSTPREHACIYSETGPVEYFNNYVHCTSLTNACQGLEVYSSGPSGSYIHNNYGLADLLSSTTLGETARLILVDGTSNAHVQYNELYSNRARLRLRDAFNAEVDHNYIHNSMLVAMHTGDSDINSGWGQNLRQSIHDNTIELAASSRALHVVDQQGVTLSNNSYLCAASGCAGAQIAELDDSSVIGVAIDQSTKILSCSTCNFYNGGRGYKTGSYVTLSGWNNAGNNGIYLVAAGPTASAPTQMVLADPSNLLTNESGTSSATATTTTVITIQSATFATSLLPEAIVQPLTVLQQCSTLGITVSGGGSLSGCN